MRVAWPDELELIETVLSRRPIFTTRHWRAPETVASLQLENEQYGVAA